MSKKDFSVALKYVEARPRSQRRKGAEARVSGISVVGSGASATDLSLLQANLISVTNNFTALKDLFDSMFEKDSAGNIHAKLSLWSSGGITAGGVGSGGSGGGGTSYNRLDAWSDYSVDKAGYVLSAALGKDLDNRVSALANAGYITASYLAPYALRSEIPSLVGYATQGWVGENYLSKAGGVMAKNSYIDWGNTDGFEDYSAYSNGFKILGYNTASGDYRGGIHVGVRYGWQLTREAGSEAFQIRNYSPSSASWGDWKTIAFTSDIPTKLSQLTDDVVAGKYLSLAGGTVNGSITANSFVGNLTGNAVSATYATTSTSLEARIYLSDINANNLYYDRSFVLRLGGSNANLPPNMSWSNILYIGGQDTGFMLAGSYSHDTLLFRRGTNANAPTQSIITNTWKTIAFTDSNVASATKLQTPRTIWGQSFDGTQDVTGALTAPAITTNSLTIGGATITYDLVNEALCVNGNIYALGGITAGGAGISAYTSLEARVARLEQQLNIS